MFVDLVNIMISTYDSSINPFEPSAQEEEDLLFTAHLTHFILLCSLAAYINKDNGGMEVKDIMNIMRSKLNNESKLYKKK